MRNFILLLSVLLLNIVVSGMALAEEVKPLNDPALVVGPELAPLISENTSQHEELDMDAQSNVSAIPSAMRKYMDTQDTGSASVLDSPSSEHKPVFGTKHKQVPNNPLDNGDIIAANQDLTTRLYRVNTALGLTLYSLQSADAGAYGANAVANQLLHDVINSTNDSVSLYKGDLKEAGAAGEVYSLGFDECLNQKNQTDEYAYLACLKSRANGASGGQTGLGGLGSTGNNLTDYFNNTGGLLGNFAGGAAGSLVTNAAGSLGNNSLTQQAGSTLSGVVSNVFNTGSGSLGNLGNIGNTGGLGNLGGASSGDQALKLCGYGQNVGVADATCDVPGVNKISAVRLSYLLYPDAEGDSANSQASKRREYREFYGDKCYVCSAGGSNQLGASNVSSDTVQLSVHDMAPEKSLVTKLKDVHASVYENLAIIFDEKCNSAAITSFTSSGNRLEGTQIFRVTDPATGEVSATWDDGDFWRSSKALTETVLPGNLTIADGLKYLSINGFRVTPSVIDALYHVTVDKGSVPQAEINIAPCDDFATYKTFDSVDNIMRASPGSRPNLKKEIKNLYLFARRLAFGKVFDACEQTNNGISALPLMPGLSSAAISQIMGICSGDPNNPDAFNSSRGENLATLDKIMTETYKTIAQNSGRSGISIASSFKAKQGQAAGKGGL